ncbi:armadillo-type protein [Cladochytrium replicatum]|nr:armadillo-type protein [Cladochytrium replicatum]
MNRSNIFARIRPICVECIEQQHWTQRSRDIGPFAALLKELKSIIRAQPRRNQEIKSDEEDGGLFNGDGDSAEEILNEMAGYILFPLKSALLSSIRSAAVAERCMECIEILSRCVEPDTVVWGDLYVTLVEILVRQNGGRNGQVGGIGIDVREQMSLLAVKCLLSLLAEIDNASCCGVPKKRDLSSRPNASVAKLNNVTGSLVSTLLDIVEAHTSANTELAYTALNVLYAVLDDGDSKLLEKRTLTMILPGVSSAMAKGVVKDEKQHHRLVVGRTRCLGSLLSNALSDSEIEEVRSSSTEDPWSALAKRVEKLAVTDDETKPQAPLRASEDQQKRKQWLKETNARLKDVFRVVFSVRFHPQLHVRLGFIDLCSKLIRTSPHALSPNIPDLVDTLVLFHSDDFPDVAAACRAELEVVEKSLDSDFGFWDMLQENAQVLLTTTMPKAVRGAAVDEKTKLEVTRLAVGYLRLLKERTGAIVALSTEKITSELLSMLEFEVLDIQFVENRSVNGDLETAVQGPLGQTSKLVGESGDRGGEADGLVSSRDARLVSRQSVHFPKHRFAHFRNERVAAAVLEMCQLIGRYCDPDLLFSSAMKYITPQKVPRSDEELVLGGPAIFLMSQFCVGISTSDDGRERRETTGQIGYLRSFIRDILDSGVLDRPASFAEAEILRELLPGDASSIDPKISSSQSASSAMTKMKSASVDSNVVKIYQSNVLNVTLALEALARVAQAMGPTFQNALIDVLYPLLEKAGHPTRIISDSAFAALTSIADVCGYSYADAALAPSIGVSNLIVGNVDYVVNMACRRIRHVSMNPRVTSVLRSVIRFSGYEIIRYIDDTVSEVLDALDRYHSLYPSLVAMLFGVLYEVVDTIEVHKSGECDGREIAARRKGPKLEPTRVDRLLDLIPVANEDVQPSPALVEWREEFVARKKERGEREKARREQADIDEIREFFKDEIGYYQKGGDSLQDLRDQPMEDPSGDTGNEGPPPPTYDERLALEIMAKVNHYLLSDSPEVRHLALRVFSTCLRVLRDREQDRGKAVHAAWPLILNRLTDREHYIVLEAVETITCIAEVAREFVSRRMVEDLIPRAVGVLKMVHARHLERIGESVEKDHRWRRIKGPPPRKKIIGDPGRYGAGGGALVTTQAIGGPSKGGARGQQSLSGKYSIEFKILSATLSALSTILSHVALHTMYVESYSILCDVIIPFLSMRWYGVADTEMPRSGALEVLERIGKVDLEVVWFKLMALSGFVPPLPRKTRLDSPQSDYSVRLNQVVFPAWLPNKLRGGASSDDYVDGVSVVFDRLGIIYERAEGGTVHL